MDLDKLKLATKELMDRLLTKTKQSIFKNFLHNRGVQNFNTYIINTLQSLNNIGFMLFELQITHSWYILSIQIDSSSHMRLNPNQRAVAPLS